MGICELCKREVEALTRHHLKPKARGGAKGMCAMVCLSCKDMIHKLISNKDLDKTYNSIPMLLQHGKIQTYVNWIKKQKNESVTMAEKKRRL